MSGLWLSTMAAAPTGKRSEASRRVEPLGPEIVQANDVKAANLYDLIPQDSNAHVGRQGCDPLRDVRLRPADSIIVVAKDPERATPAKRQMRKHPSGMLKHLGFVAREIPGVNDKLRGHLLDPLKASYQVTVIDSIDRCAGRSTAPVAILPDPSAGPLWGAAAPPPQANAARSATCRIRSRPEPQYRGRGLEEPTACNQLIIAGLQELLRRADDRR